MGKQLSDEAVRTRLVRLNNLEKMYATQVKRNKKLKKENKKLKLRVVELENENRELRDRVQKLELIVEELQAMIFKKMKPKKDKDDSSSSEKISKKKRSKASYRRPVPNEDEVTDIEAIEVGGCQCCGGEFSRIEEVVRYIEDIILPLEEQFIMVPFSGPVDKKDKISILVEAEGALLFTSNYVEET